MWYKYILITIRNKYIPIKLSAISISIYIRAASISLCFINNKVRIRMKVFQLFNRTAIS